jgi:hypothetical protein
MQKSTCTHCGIEIGLWLDPWGGHPEWMHHPDDGPDAYHFCHCKCVGCTSDSCDYTECCDGEEAQPPEFLPAPQPVVAIMDAEPEEL